MHPKPRSLSLAIWMMGSIAVFALVGSFALLWVFSEAATREERATFEALARANASFLDHSSLPRSAQMAAQLSTVTGARVFFVHSATDSLVGDATGEETAIARSVIADGKARQHDGAWIIAHALKDGSRVYFSNPAPHRTATLDRSETWLALIAFWTLALGLGAWLAHRVAAPIQALARALPAIGTEGSLPLIPSDRADEIGQLARALTVTHEALCHERHRRRTAERLALLGQMAASLAHEVRNPITAIKLHAQLLDGASPADADASRTLIEAEAERIESLVQQWLHFAKPAPPVLHHVDLFDLVATAIQAAKLSALHANVTLRHEANTQEAAILADRQRVAQALTNVINNAIQAMPSGGDLLIRVSAETDKCSAEFEDTGTGFSAIALQRLAEPFYSEKEGGMGLGLAVTREICRAHGGELTVTASSSGGARVTLTFARELTPTSVPPMQL